MDDSSSSLVAVTCAHHHDDFISGLWRLYQSQRKVDFNLRLGAGRRPLRAHRLLLELFLPSEVLEDQDWVAPSPEMEFPDDDQLDYVVEFLYRGTVSVPRQQLDGLLRVAQQLQFDMLTKTVLSLQTESLTLGGSSCQSAIDVSTTKGEADVVPTPKNMLFAILRVSPRKKAKVVEEIHEVCAESDSVPIDTEADTYSSEADADGAPPASKDNSRLAAYRAYRVAWRLRQPLLLCEFCPYQNRRKDNLMVHMAKHHPNADLLLSSCPADLQPVDTVRSAEREGDETPARTPSKNGQAGNCRVSPRGKRKVDAAPPPRTRPLDPRVARDRSYKKAWRQRQPLLRCDHCTYESRRKDHLKEHVAKHVQVEPGKKSADEDCASPESTDGKPACRGRKKKSPKDMANSMAALLAATRAYQVAYRNRQPLLQCEHCPYQARKKENFEMHVAQNHPEAKLPFTSLTDGTPNRKRSPISAKVASKKAYGLAYRQRQPLLECEHCPFQSRKKDRYKMHAEKHAPGAELLYSYASDGRPFRKIRLRGDGEKKTLQTWLAKQPLLQCERCPYHTRKKDRFKIHLAKHEAVPVFHCPNCFATCFSAEALEKHHQARHMGEPPPDPNCLHCSFSTPFYRNMQAHLSMSHNLDANGALLPDQFECSECPYTCATEGRLKIHQRERHSGQKPFACSECNYSSSRKGDLRKHTKLMHTHERPYMCETCGYKTALPSLLIAHQRMHTGEKPYVCGTCQKGYTNNLCLKKHKLQHASDQQV